MTTRNNNNNNSNNIALQQQQQQQQQPLLVLPTVTDDEINDYEFIKEFLDDEEVAYLWQRMQRIKKILKSASQEVVV